MPGPLEVLMSQVSLELKLEHKFRFLDHFMRKKNVVFEANIFIQPIFYKRKKAIHYF